MKVDLQINERSCMRDNAMTGNSKNVVMFNVTYFPNFSVVSLEFSARHLRMKLDCGHSRIILAHSTNCRSPSAAISD